MHPLLEWFGKPEREFLSDRDFYVVTFDVDYESVHAGIIQCTFDKSRATEINRVPISNF